MQRISSNGIIYKLTKYSDHSAIALAYTEEYGKVKLFVEKAFSKKKSILTLTPCEVDFIYKENTDLHKLYSYAVLPAYLSYSTDPILLTRLSLFMDLFDKFYALLEEDPTIWKVILAFNEKPVSEISKVHLFGLYLILQNTGNIFNYTLCNACSSFLSSKAVILKGETLCYDCFQKYKEDIRMKKLPYITINDIDIAILKCLSHKEAYSELEITVADEIRIADILISYAEIILERELPSYKLFQDMINLI